MTKAILVQYRKMNARLSLMKYKKRNTGLAAATAALQNALKQKMEINHQEALIMGTKKTVAVDVQKTLCFFANRGANTSNL